MAWVFNSTGGVTAGRSINVTTTTSAPCGARTKIRGHAGLWYLITAGSLAGYSVQEVPGSVYLRGTCLPVRYLPYRAGTLAQAVPTAVQPPPTTGAPLPTRAVDLAKGTTVMVDQRLTINAVQYLELADGPNTGWWVPSAAVQL